MSFNHANNFIQRNIILFIESPTIKQINNKITEITFTVDQSVLRVNGISFLTQNCPAFIYPKVINANIVDVLFTVPGYFYFTAFLQNCIDIQLLDACKSGLLNTQVKINLLKYNNISQLHGQIKYVKIILQFCS